MDLDLNKNLNQFVSDKIQIERSNSDKNRQRTKIWDISILGKTSNWWITDLLYTG